MVQRDIPMIVCPIAYQKVDRGVVLENQWKTLAIPFVHLYEEEKQGRRPSIVVSPMVIESGERHVDQQPGSAAPCPAALGSG